MHACTRAAVGRGGQNGAFLAKVVIIVSEARIVACVVDMSVYLGMRHRERRYAPHSSKTLVTSE